MKTKYANTELKCGSTIPGDDLLVDSELEDAMSRLFDEYVIQGSSPLIESYLTDSVRYTIAYPRLFGTITNVSVD
jgi:hypothetical protein